MVISPKVEAVPRVCLIQRGVNPATTESVLTFPELRTTQTIRLVARDRSAVLPSVDFGKSGDRMPASKSYQRFATRCLEEACKASDLKQKALFAEMAQEWQRLAEQAIVAHRNCTNTSNSEPDRGD